MLGRHPQVFWISLQVAVAYALLGATWIFFSDRFLESAGLDAATLTQLQTYKGWFYVFLTAVLAFVLWYFSHAKLEETTKRVRDERAHKHTMLQSIGDAVIATDAKANIILINPEAARLTGWTEEEAMGKPLEQIFPIINGQNREPLESPVRKVIQTGGVVGLANHTILLRKDGAEFQIADSGAPIFDESGKVNGIILVFRDVTDDYALQAELRRMRFAIEKASLGIFQIGEDGHILYTNPAATNSLGYKEGELAGRLITDIDPKFTLESWKKHSRETLCEGGSRTIQSLHKRKDGSTFPVEVQVNYLEFEGERFSFSFAKDLSQREKARKKLLAVNEELRLAKERAESSDRAKSEFLAVVSHELRTPLNPILGFTSVLQHELTRKEHLDYLDTIHSSGKRMLAMVEEILDYIQLDRESLRTHEEPFSPLRTCRQAVQEISPTAGHLSLELLDPEGATAAMEARYIWCGDARLLTRILVNLLSNACKFTERGFVRLQVFPDEEPDDEARRWFTFIVEDSGVGIPGDRLQEIFEPFHQLDSSRTRRAHGLGMGLAICQKLTKLLNGKLDVESKVGEGTRFMLRVPLRSQA